MATPGGCCWTTTALWEAKFGPGWVKWIQRQRMLYYPDIHDRWVVLRTDCTTEKGGENKRCYEYLSFFFCRRRTLPGWRCRMVNLMRLAPSPSPTDQPTTGTGMMKKEKRFQWSCGGWATPTKQLGVWFACWCAQSFQGFALNASTLGYALTRNHGRF